MEEKYKLCDETLTKLLQWIADVEDKLAHQDVVNEDIEELRNQINSLKVCLAIEEPHVNLNTSLRIHTKASFCIFCSK